MFGFDSKGDIGSHDSARNMGHPAGHDGHQFGASEIGQKRPYGQGRFRLSHKNAGGYVQRLGAARAHDAGHHACSLLNDELHDAVVIKDGEKRRYEDDCRQHLKSEIETKTGTLLAQVSENKLGTNESVAKQLINGIASVLKNTPTNFNSQDEYRESELQAQTPGDCFATDGSPVGRKNIGQTQHRQQA